MGFRARHVFRRQLLHLFAVARFKQAEGRALGATERARQSLPQRRFSLNQAEYSGFEAPDRFSGRAKMDSQFRSADCLRIRLQFSEGLM